MGQCGSIELAGVAECPGGPVMQRIPQVPELAPELACCAPVRVQAVSCSDPHPLAQKKGLTVWVDSVDELVQALPFELDTDLEHLHALPEGLPLGTPSFEAPSFARDVGVRCE